jgi:hypothetical protein
MPSPIASPRSIADAYRTLTDPAAHGCHPAVIQTNWKFLKEGRGQRFYADRLAITSHLIAPCDVVRAQVPDGRAVSIPVRIERMRPAPDFRFVAPAQSAAVNQVDAARIRAIPRIQRAIYALWGDDEPKGAA